MFFKNNIPLIFFKVIFMGFLIWEYSEEMTEKYWDGDRGAGSAKDLEMGFELWSMWAQSMHLLWLPASSYSSNLKKKKI